MILVYGLISFLAGSVLFNKAAGGLGFKYANVVTWVYYYYVFIFLIPAFSNAIGLYSDWMTRQAIYMDSAVHAFYATFASFVALPALVLFLQKLFKIQPKLESRALFEFSKQMVEKDNIAAVLFWLIVAAIVLPCLLLIVIAVLDLPIEYLIRGGDWLEMAIRRRQWVMAEDRWIQYFRNIIGKWVAPLASLIALGCFMKRRRLFTLILCIWLTVIAILYLFSSLERAPVLYFLIAFFYVWSVFNGGISVKRLLATFVMVASLGLLLLYITLRFDDFFEIILYFLERVFFAQYSGTVLTFDFFPRLEPFLGFSGLCHGLLGRLLECDGIRYSLLLMQTYNPGAWAAERVGYMSTLYIAEGYACLGISGIVFSILVVSIWLTGLQWLFFRLRPHPVFVGVLSLLMVRIISLLGDGLLVFVYPSEFIVPTILVLFLIYLERKRLVLIIKRSPGFAVRTLSITER